MNWPAIKCNCGFERIQLLLFVSRLCCCSKFTNFNLFRLHIFHAGSFKKIWLYSIWPSNHFFLNGVYSVYVMGYIYQNLRLCERTVFVYYTGICTEQNYKRNAFVLPPFFMSWTQKSKTFSMYTKGLFFSNIAGFWIPPGPPQYSKTAHFRVAFYCGQPKAHLWNNNVV